MASLRALVTHLTGSGEQVWMIQHFSQITPLVLMQVYTVVDRLLLLLYWRAIDSSRVCQETNPSLETLRLYVYLHSLEESLAIQFGPCDHAAVP